MLKVFSLLSGEHASTFLSATIQLLKREQMLLQHFWFLQESISTNQERDSILILILCQDQVLHVNLLFVSIVRKN